MKKIIIDCDCAMGIFGRDIDDGLALLLALRSPELDVAGVTVCFGNVDVDRGVRSVRQVLEAAGRTDVPVLRGAASRSDLGRETDASRFIRDRIDAHPGEIALVPIAPLTNLATAEMLAPSVLCGARRVVCMGGAVYRGGLFPAPFNGEFNFYMDADAASLVVERTPNMALIPLDVTTSLVFGPEQFGRLQRADTPLARFLRPKVASWYRLNRLLPRLEGFWPHDPLAVAFLLKPDLFEVRQEKICVTTKFPHAGCVKRGEGRDADVCVKVRKDAFFELLLGRILE